MCYTEKKVEKLKVFCFSVLIFLEQQSELPDILLYVSNKNNLTIISLILAFFKEISAIFGSLF